MMIEQLQSLPRMIRQPFCCSKNIKGFALSFKVDVMPLKNPDKITLAREMGFRIIKLYDRN